MPVTEGQKPDTNAPVEQIKQASISDTPLTEGQKSKETALPEGEKPSKSALKKAAKEKEKAEKAAKREQQEREEREKAAANDTASHLYGRLNYEDPPPFAEKFLDLGDFEGVGEDTRVTFEARVGNARVQSAKLGFLVLRDGFDSIQVVVAEGGEHGISRLMIKWCGGLNTESIVRATGLVKTPKEDVKSTTISHKELHLESIYVVAEAPEQLPIQVKDCNQPPPGEEEGEAENEGLPNVGLKARLDNKVLSLRAPAGEAIIKLESEVTRLFNEYMFQHKFTDIQPSYLAGAATEGGAGVFEVKYFEEKAYLTQSPQFFKQMVIAGGLKRVFLVGPVFRAENSNTKRHLTEVRSPTPRVPPCRASDLTTVAVHRSRFRNDHPAPLPRSPRVWRKPHDLHHPQPPNARIHQETHPNHQGSRLPRRRHLPAATRRQSRAHHIRGSQIAPLGSWHRRRRAGFRH